MTGERQPNTVEKRASEAVQDIMRGWGLRCPYGMAVEIVRCVMRRVRPFPLDLETEPHVTAVLEMFKNRSHLRRNENHNDPNDMRLICARVVNAVLEGITPD